MDVKQCTEIGITDSEFRPTSMCFCTLIGYNLHNYFVHFALVSIKYLWHTLSLSLSLSLFFQDVQCILTLESFYDKALLEA
jgi:hypothetical protein